MENKPLNPELKLKEITSTQINEWLNLSEIAAEAAQLKGKELFDEMMNLLYTLPLEEKIKEKKLLLMQTAMAAVEEQIGPFEAVFSFGMVLGIEFAKYLIDGNVLNELTIENKPADNCKSLTCPVHGKRNRSIQEYNKQSAQPN